MKVIDFDMLVVHGGAPGLWVLITPRVRGGLCQLQ